MPKSNHLGWKKKPSEFICVFDKDLIKVLLRVSEFAIVSLWRLREGKRDQFGLLYTVYSSLIISLH